MKKKPAVKAEKGEATKAAAKKKTANAKKSDAKKTAAKRKRKPIVVLDPLDLQAGPGGIDPMLRQAQQPMAGGMGGPGAMGLDPMMQGGPPMGDPMMAGGPGMGIPPGPPGMPLAPEAMPRQPLPRRRLV